MNGLCHTISSMDYHAMPLRSAKSCASGVKWKHYVYVLMRADGTPFYVGKGKGPRLWRHKRSAENGADAHKDRVIRKEWSEGRDALYLLDSFHAGEASAFVRESQLIRSIGRLDLGAGPLVNVTDGGDGCPNASDDTRARLRANMEQRWQDPELRHRYTVVAREAMKDPSVEAATRAGLEKSWAQWSDPERRAEMCKARSEGYTPERKAVLSAASKARWADPEWRAKMAASRAASPAQQARKGRPNSKGKAAWANMDSTRRAEIVSKRREAMAARWADPVWRATVAAKLRAVGKARRGDPKYTAIAASNALKARSALAAKRKEA